MTPQQLAEMRELFLSTPVPPTIRGLALLTGVGLLIAVLWLVRRRSLREELAPIWLAVALAITAISVWPAPLLELSRAIGAWSHTSTLFYLGNLFLVAICLGYAVRLSRLTLQVKNLSQEVALLWDRLERRVRAPDGG